MHKFTAFVLILRLFGAQFVSTDQIINRFLERVDARLLCVDRACKLAQHRWRGRWGCVDGV